MKWKMKNYVLLSFIHLLFTHSIDNFKSLTEFTVKFKAVKKTLNNFKRRQIKKIGHWNYCIILTFTHNNTIKTKKKTMKTTIVNDNDMLYCVEIKKKQ